MHTSTTSTVPLEPWTAEQLQQATQGEWHNARIPKGEVKRILTDSRHAEAGDVFLALTYVLEQKKRTTNIKKETHTNYQ